MNAIKSRIGDPVRNAGEELDSPLASVRWLECKLPNDCKSSPMDNIDA